MIFRVRCRKVSLCNDWNHYILLGVGILRFHIFIWEERLKGFETPYFVVFTNAISENDTLKVFICYRNRT